MEEFTSGFILANAIRYYTSLDSKSDKFEAKNKNIFILDGDHLKINLALKFWEYYKDNGIQVSGSVLPLIVIMFAYRSASKLYAKHLNDQMEIVKKANLLNEKALLAYVVSNQLTTNRKSLFFI